METITNTPEMMTETTTTVVKKSSPIKGILFLFGAIVLIAAGAFGYKIYQDQIAPDDNQKTDTTETTTGTLEVNSFSDAGGETNTKYSTFQIKYNSSYFVTSDEMLTDYKSQGGSAAPRLVLSTDIQPLGTVNYEKLLSQNDGKAITIWSTIGLDNIEEWLDQRGITNPVTVSEEEITVGDYVFEKMVLSSDAKSQNIVVAYLALPNDYSYFFETNNTSAEKDLVFMLNNFDMRGDIE